MPTAFMRYQRAQTLLLFFREFENPLSLEALVEAGKGWDMRQLSLALHHALQKDWIKITQYGALELTAVGVRARWDILLKCAAAMGPAVQ